MAEVQRPGPTMTPEELATAQFQVQRLYMKDMSWETPNVPEIFKDNGQADVKLSLAQNVNPLEENLHEVVLTVTVTATVGERTAYLAEVAQAGIFLISGLQEQAMHAVMNTVCPNTLFPYARQAISNLVSQGGFPPLLLQPINFDQLYAERVKEMMAEQNKDDDQAVDAVFATND